MANASAQSDSVQKPAAGYLVARHNQAPMFWGFIQATISCTDGRSLIPTALIGLFLFPTSDNVLRASGTASHTPPETI